MKVLAGITLADDKRSLRRPSLVACSLLLLCASAGCGRSGLQRATVSGEVTFNGEPVNDGVIRFVSLQEAPNWAATITDGRYSTEGTRGAPAGEVRIEIEAYRLTPGFEPSPEDDALNGGGPPKDQYLPAKFNIESELQMTIPSDGSPINKDFHLQ